ncbi:TrlF family AAA-like ATPase [Ornithobacterium rhinotracheale]
MENNRGSEWRKWDLHIHTKGTNKNDQFNSSSMEDFLFIFFKKAIEQNISAIGVTDYFSIERYLEVEEYKKNIRNKKDACGNQSFSEDEIKYIEQIFIFPNVELRMLPSTDKGRLINIHFIFNPKITQDLDNDFFCELKNQDGFKMNRKGLIDYGKKLDSTIRDDTRAYKKGINSFTVDVKTIKDLLYENTILRENSIVVVSNSNKDGASGLQKHYDLFENEDGGLDGVRQTIYEMSNAIFSANSKDVKFFLGRKSQGTPEYNNDVYLQEVEEVIKKVGSLKPCLVGCDAHKEEDLFKRFTWIKADTTFEGLKQIIYEPEERVRIQENNPELDFEKPFFSSINFFDNEKIFEDDEIRFDQSTEKIPLNPNLVAIIGGRGEGKSMLMDYISTSFYNKKSSKSGNFVKNGNIEVIYSKTIKNKEEVEIFPIKKDSNHALDFIYINQGELKNIVEDKQQKSKLADEISKMANINEVVFDEDLDRDVNEKLDELHKVIEFLDNEKNNIEELESQEIKLKEFIENITTDENREKLQNYSEILEKKTSEKEKKEKLNQLELSLNRKVDELNQEITNINHNNVFEIPLINADVFKTQIQYIKEQNLLIEKKIQKLDNKIDSIKNNFKDVYTGDLSTLLKDVDKYQEELSDIRSKIKEVNKKTNDKKDLIEKIFDGNNEEKSYVSKIKEDYEKQKESILNDWNSFNKIDEREDLSDTQKQLMKDLLQDLNIDITIDFDEEAFYDQIYNCINGTEWRVKNNREAQKDYLKIVDLNSFFKYLTDRYLSDYYERGLYGDKLKMILFDQEERKKYIKVYPILKYKGKDINRISVGQKGTMYLKMKLATEAFSKPIIFDQPEDDLDNEFIINNLIGLFKELKKYRQIIIITHNANLVVNADAEQIIVAKNDNDKLSYVSGSLENPNINKHICKILEGGEQAFKKREQKYGFR